MNNNNAQKSELSASAQQLIEGGKWSLIVLYDGCDLTCTLTRELITFQLYDEQLGSFSFQSPKELLNATRVCSNVEEHVGLSLSKAEWISLLESACVHVWSPGLASWEIGLEHERLGWI